MDENDFIQNYCRICASNRPNKRNLFEVIYDEKRLINVLEHCLKRALDTDIYYPKCICSDCSAALINTYEFFTLFEKSEKWFAQRYNAPTVAQVKCETVELPLAEGENKNMLDILLKTEQGIEDLDIGQTQSLLEIKNELISDCECEGNEELTGDLSDHQFEFVPLGSDTTFRDHICNKIEHTKDDEIPTHSTQIHNTTVSGALQFRRRQRKRRQASYRLKLSSAWSFECYVCKQTFGKHMHLLRHMKSHTTNNRVVFECSHCSKCFLNGHNFRKHLRKHTDSIFNCEYCAKSFKSKGDLKSHVYIVHKSAIKEFGCTIKGCSAIFPLKFLLKLHVSRHFETERFQELLCPECGNIYTNSKALCAHRRTHDTEKPFCCNHCPARFKFVCLLKDHAQIHSNKKEFICDVHLTNGDVCGKAFAAEKGLRTHKMIHTNVKNYKCEWTSCTKVFNTKFKLDRHILTHTGDSNP